MIFNVFKPFFILFIVLLMFSCGEDKQTENTSEVTNNTHQGSFNKADSGDRPSGTNNPSLYRAGNRYGWGGQDKFVDDILPIFAKRCASCHGCVDSPCQLKLTSYETISRGSNPNNIFGDRVMSTYQTRAQDGRITNKDGTINFSSSINEWREREFYSVTDNDENSIMNKLLNDAHKLTPEVGLSRTFELYENGLKARSFECLGSESSGVNGPKQEDMIPRAMPFGCPKIEDEHYNELSEWLKNGAAGPSLETQKLLKQPINQNIVDKWEIFFNKPENKGKLVSRFIYEHMFTSKVHFPESPGDYYELVRSWTAPGEPIVEIVTQIPNDDPAMTREYVTIDDNIYHSSGFYYRLRKYTAIIVEKNLITWELNDEILSRWNELFYSNDWGTEPILDPGYESYNPFEYFAQIPSKVRYKFLIENSFHLIEAIVKADVCTGSTATYAVRDHFWVWFLDPESDPSAKDSLLGESDYSNLDPTGNGLLTEKDYLQSFERSLRQLKPNGFSLEDIWDGGGTNENAMITVLRHSKSSSAHKGAYNGKPNTYWILSFSNFERLYYSLVVNFNAWGTLEHRMSTWEYMCSIRSDAEELFLSFLPENLRNDVRDMWTSSFGRVIQDIFYEETSDGRPSQVEVDFFTPVTDLVNQILNRMSDKVKGPNDNINIGANNSFPPPVTINTIQEFEYGLSTLTGRHTPFARFFPNISYLRVAGESGKLYTVISNRGYKYHNSILLENLSRDPEHDFLSINSGLTGFYPELFIDVPSSRMRDFIDHVEGINSLEDWNLLLEVYAQNSSGEEIQYIHRKSPNFWNFLDWIHNWNVKNNPTQSGIIDVSEYVWPELYDHSTPELDDSFEPNNSRNQALTLDAGVHNLIMCGNEDWFSISIPSESTLAIEIAFDADMGDIDAKLEGDNIEIESTSWFTPYENFSEKVNPGIYKLGIYRNYSSSCQHYTLLISIY